MVLESDPRTLSVEEMEKELNGSEEVASLSTKAKAALEEFALAKDRYGPEDDIVKARLHDLYLAKKALDEHPLSIEYNCRYVALRRLYAEIDEILLGQYRVSGCCNRKRS